MVKNKKASARPTVVIIGGGFGGLTLAKSLRDAPVEVILIDKRNYHTFQPLLYQVAIGALEADSIAFPIRRQFTKQKNIKFELAEVTGIDHEKDLVHTDLGQVHYDQLVIATGATTNFFGDKQIERFAMPMKSLPEALDLRSVIIQNLEAASRCSDKDEKAALLTFIVVGGGPAGVELAGALSEMRRLILMKDYHQLSAMDMSVYLVEGKPKLLAAMSDQASKKVKEYLKRSSVVVYNDVHVKSYDGLELLIDNGKVLRSRNVFWTTGVVGVVPPGIPENIIQQGNKIAIDDRCRVKGMRNIFAIGDVSAMMNEEWPNGLPGVAPVAIQQAKFIATSLDRILDGKELRPFVYKDKGAMATVG